VSGRRQHEKSAESATYHDSDGDVGTGELLRLRQPAPYMRKSVASRHVEDDQGTGGVTVIRARYTPEGFLASRVPDLKLHFLIPKICTNVKQIHFFLETTYYPGSEIDSDG
jgi:hypothetical protein